MLPNQVPAPVMAERLARLQALVEAQRQGFNGATLGRTVEVLLERPGRHPGQLTGKSPYLQQVQVEGPATGIGEVMPVRIVALGANSLFGELADYPARSVA